MTTRFAILLAFNLAELGILWGLARMLWQIRAVQSELGIMVGEATRGIVDRTQELHQMIGELHQHQASERKSVLAPEADTKASQGPLGLSASEMPVHTAT